MVLVITGAIAALLNPRDSPPTPKGVAVKVLK